MLKRLKKNQRQKSKWLRMYLKAFYKVPACMLVEAF
jgi:hypothetical protein